MKAVRLAILLGSVHFMGFAQSVPESLFKGQPSLPDYIEKPADAAGIFAIYAGSGIPKSSETWTWHEQSSLSQGDTMVRNVVIPTLTMFTPKKGKSNGSAIIVGPGGAFHFLMMGKEGYATARKLTDLGFTTFVLKYRVQNTPEKDADLQIFLSNLFKTLPKVSDAEVYPPMSHPGAEEDRLWGEEDGRQAIRFLREHADEFKIKPDKIGIMGFSAGGGISINAALQHDALSRPDFVGGIYAGYRIISPVPADLPPLFLAIASDDKAVAAISSARLFEDWHKTGANAELHIFSSGQHGFGTLPQQRQSDQWFSLFTHWLADRGFL